MNPDLAHILSAFGLGAASGLNASLPLALVGLLARFGVLTLAPPFDALGSDLALAGLLTIAVLEFLSDKVPGLDSVGHALLFPLAVTAGAILFATSTSSGAVTSIQPGAQIVIALLAGGATAGGVHTIRTAMRPLLHPVLPFVGPVVSVIEDGMALALTGAALFAPALVPVLLLVMLVGMFVLGRLLLVALRKIFGWFRELLGGPRSGGRIDGDPDDEFEGAPTAAPAWSVLIRGFHGLFGGRGGNTAAVPDWLDAEIDDEDQRGDKIRRHNAHA